MNPPDPTCKPRSTLKVNCKIWLSRRKIIKMLLPLSCRNGHQNIKGARKGAHRHPDLQQRPDAGSKAASLSARTYSTAPATARPAHAACAPTTPGEYLTHPARSVRRSLH